MRRFLPALTLLALASALAGGVAAQDSSSQPTTINGLILERGTITPVEGVSLVMIGLEGPGQVSNDRGRFRFSDVPPGFYVLRMTHIAYHPVEDTLEVPPGSLMDLDVRLVPRTLEMDPIVVVASYSTRGKMRAFYDRLHNAPGSFITRADFEEANVAYVTDIMRRIPGLRMIPRRAGGVTLGQFVTMRGGCRPAIFIDGVLAAEAGLSIDELFRPDQIEGIEIYRGPQTPAAFQRNQCGSILFWTRPGGGPQGRLPFWKMAVVAGLFAVVALFLTQ